MTDQINTKTITGATTTATGTTKPRPIMIKPKRPISSFFMYKRDRYADVVSKHPELKIADITKIISDEWASSVAADKKEAYKKTYNVNKEKYLLEVEKYKKWKAEHGDSDAEHDRVSIDFYNKIRFVSACQCL